MDFLKKLKKNTILIFLEVLRTVTKKLNAEIYC